MSPSKNFSFFILDGEIDIKNGPVSLTVDHPVIISVEYPRHRESLAQYEKEFAIWYQEQVLIKGVCSGLCFILDSSVMRPYDQNRVCKEILNYLRVPIE